jgi:hypothetical protein
LSLEIAKACVPLCECGNNPYAAYFLAGKQALIEAVVLVQAAEPRDHPETRYTDVSKLYRAIHSIAQRKVDDFCSVCQFRQAGTGVPVTTPG